MQLPSLWLSVCWHLWGLLPYQSEKAEICLESAKTPTFISPVFSVSYESWNHSATIHATTADAIIPNVAKIDSWIKTFTAPSTLNYISLSVCMAKLLRLLRNLQVLNNMFINVTQKQTRLYRTLPILSRRVVGQHQKCVTPSFVRCSQYYVSYLWEIDVVLCWFFFPG